MSEFIKSSVIRWVLICLGAFIILTATFLVGVRVGAHKERNLSRWNENYGNMFMMGGRRPGFPGTSPLGMPMFSGGHGVFGNVLSVSESNVMIQGKDNVEQNVLVTSSTSIRIGNTGAALKDIQPGMLVAVMGEPNDKGEVEARLIRIFGQQ